MQKMTKMQKRVGVAHTYMLATFYFPLVSFVSFMAWVRGWKVDPKNTERNPCVMKEEFVQGGFLMVRFGGTTWNTGKRVSETTR